MDFLGSLELNFDLYCSEIDLFRLESMSRFEEGKHLDFELKFRPENKLE